MMRNPDVPAYTRDAGRFSAFDDESFRYRRRAINGDRRSRCGLKFYFITVPRKRAHFCGHIASGQNHGVGRITTNRARTLRNPAQPRIRNCFARRRDERGAHVFVFRKRRLIIRICNGRRRNVAGTRSNNRRYQRCGQQDHAW